MSQHKKDFAQFLDEFLDDGLPPNGLDARISDIGLDSLSLLELIQAIETEYEVEIDLAELRDRSTLHDLAARALA